MKAGLVLPMLHSVEINEQMAQLATSLGFDSLWLPDHMLGVVHPQLWKDFAASASLPDADAWLDPFCIAAILGRQSNLLIGTAVTDGTKRRGADLARATLTLHHAARGGFVLGIGAGEAESLVPFGYDFSRPVGKLEETLIELRAMLDTGHMPDGGIGRTGLALTNDRGRPQIWVAATGERALNLAGRYGDGWIPIGLSVEQYSEKHVVVRTAAATAGRPMPTASMSPVILLGNSRAHVAEALELQPLAKLILLFAPAALWRRYGMEHPSGLHSRGTLDAVPHVLNPEMLRDVARRVPFEMVEEFVLLGSAADVAARLAQYASVGLEHVVLGDITGLVYPPEESGRLLMGEMAALINALHVMAPH